MTVALIGGGVSLLLIVIATILMVYTEQYLVYLKQHPVVHPQEPSDYQPDGGFLGCQILNHTYFNRSGDALIDVYATIALNNTGCPFQKTIRYYGEFLQSCRCHNASQVNKTIDDEFPIGKIIFCCINNDCALFNNVCNPQYPSYTEPSPDIPQYTFFYAVEWACLFFFASALVGFCGFAILDKCRKKGYEALKK